MTGLDHVLDRTVTIAARRETVFRYFTDSERFAAWWGPGSRIDPRPGGKRAHPPPERRRGRRRGGGDHPGRARGLHLRLRERPADPDRRLAGHDHARGDRPGDDRPASPRASHRRGARRARAGLALSARGLRERRGHGGARRTPRRSPIGSSPSGARPTRRSGRRELQAVAIDTLAFRDPYSCTDGLDDLNAHIAAAQRFMPGVVLERQGEARQCQGLAIVDWSRPGQGREPPGEGLERLRARPGRPHRPRHGDLGLAPGACSGRGLSFRPTGGERMRDVGRREFLGAVTAGVAAAAAAPGSPTRRPPLPASRSPSSDRCRSARYARPAGSRGSCCSSGTASPATSTCSGRTSRRASGSAARPRAGSARPTGSTGRSRSPSSSTTRPSRPGSPDTSTTSSPTSARTAGTRPTPRTPRRSATTCGRSCS